MWGTATIYAKNCDTGDSVDVAGNSELFVSPIEVAKLQAKRRLDATKKARSEICFRLMNF